jgi:hypothetical protein
MSIRSITFAAAAALAVMTTAAQAHQPIRTPAEACQSLRRAGIIPGNAPARVVGFPDLGNHRPFLCLLPGQSAKGLRVRFTLAPLFEDEPARIEVLGTAREPLGCMTDFECELIEVAEAGPRFAETASR